MDNFTHKTYQQPTFNPRTFSTYKYNIPEKKPSDEIINNLFLVVSEGNYLKIKDFLLRNHMSMISKNDAGESVLHIIIQNSNITQNEKLELVQLAIEKGAQIISFDQNNITPLHYACKYQLTKIVELLLNNHANPNAIDNQYKTPLHYAIVGESTICPDINKKKIKPLIPSLSIKLEQNKLINDVYNYIYKFIFTDNVIKNHIITIKNSFDIFINMYPYELIKIMDNIKQEISNILSDSTLSENNIQTAIFDKLTELKKPIHALIQTKISEATLELPIKPNTYDGWGPDDLPQNRILPTKNIIELANFIDISLQKKK